MDGAFIPIKDIEPVQYHSRQIAATVKNANKKASLLGGATQF